jgi:radical SAM protein with 4Fe4S-binding SPASM domain
MSAVVCRIKQRAHTIIGIPIRTVEIEETLLYTRLHPILTIFAIEYDNSQLVYTPGHLAVVTPPQALDLKNLWNHQEWSNDQYVEKLASSLTGHAHQVAASWQHRCQVEYAPECLMISLGDRCNADCVYCYNECRDRTPGPAIMSEKMIMAASRLVAGHCRQKAVPFQLAIHGGGEPTLYWEGLCQAVRVSKTIADQYQLDWSGYLASNGIFDEEKALWLSDHFNMVGISCDGPAYIQDRQRPLKNGGSSSAIVERNIRFFHSRGTAVRARATITPWTMKRQKEIVTYLAGELGVARVHFEPVYKTSAKAGLTFSSRMAGPFVQNFLVAQQEAEKFGCTLTLSAVRLDEIHGPYCHFLNQTLHLKPSGTIAPCFFAEGEGVKIPALGAWDEVINEIVLDSPHISCCRSNAMRIPQQCQACINLYHCSRKCPDVCYVTTPEENPPPSPGRFRCEFQQQLSVAWIREAAGSRQVQPFRAGQVKPGYIDRLNDIPIWVDKADILQQWQATQGYGGLQQRRLPLPVWGRRGFVDNGAAAWEKLTDRVNDPVGCETRGLSVYVHIPFCDRRCKFCDCYSFPLSTQNQRLERLYIESLQKEIKAWASLGNLCQRPVTTVHFGGGTPGVLAPEHFREVVECCKVNLGVNAQTEWALESTSTLVNQRNLDEWKSLGFSRLHIGIQTLEDQVREHLGRKECTGQLLEKLYLALGMGYIVSVDVIYGLPGQTLQGFIETLMKLIALGLDGFSLYQLQVSRRNKAWLQQYQHNLDDSEDYLFLQVAEHVLQCHNYAKNHFNHYARSRDQNLYYTYPQRREDLLGLGTSASGCFGDYHYRNPGFKPYISGTGEGRPALVGGMEELPKERKLRCLNTALAAGAITADMMQDLGLNHLLDRWREALCLIEDRETGRFTLNGNGSWFIGQMCAEALDAVTIP